jgi:putative molybdopterin biosynthesis protein
MRTANRLHEIRTRRGIGVAELARQIGVSRQTIYATEAGDYVPNTTVALQLARALEVSVEEVFELQGDAPALTKPFPVELLGAAAPPGQPVQLCQVGKRLLGISASAQALGLPLADGILVDPGSVQTFEDRSTFEKRLLIAGCDPAISVLAQYLLRSEGIELITAPCSSRTALELLRDGKVHIAGSHLRDDRTGEYNLPMIKTVFPRGGMQVVTFAIWEQGLVTAHGNPKGIKDITDLARKEIRIVNREAGAGSRQLLDRQLSAAGIGKQRVIGYDQIANGHLAAALAVSTGQADCCVATRAAAKAFGLFFIPLATERYDFVFPRRYGNLPVTQSLFNVLNRSILRRKLAVMADYDTTHTGEVIAG